MNPGQPSGRAGFIVPTGIATDDSTKLFFADLTTSGRLASLTCYENEEFIFPAVHHAFRFGLMTISGHGGARDAELVFFARQPVQIHDPRRRFSLTAQDFALINPNTLTCPVFRSERDAELTKKLYRRVPVLVSDGPPELNPWGIKFSQGLFNMTSDSHLFADEPLPDSLPLYEAKMIHQFDHRWASFSTDGNGVDVTLDQKTDPNFSVTPRYWVSAADVEVQLADKSWNRKWLVGWRGIARATDERSVIGGLMPLAGVGHSAHLIFPAAKISPNQVSCLVGNISCLVFDFIARQKIGGANFSIFIPKQLPVLPPDFYTDTDLAYIVPRVLELTYTAHDLAPWATDLGYTGEPFLWNPERRAQLRAQLDAYYARLYGLNRDELRYILDPADVMGEDYPSETFRVLKNNEMREFGEYRTQRLVLAAWDAMEQGSKALASV